MASFYKLNASATAGPGSIIEAVFAAIQEAEDSIERERRAVVRLQAIFRSWTAKKLFVQTVMSVLRIQRVYRGYKDRCRALRLVIARKQHKQNQLFHHCATVVQSRYRGYHTRLRVADFYKQKRYLADVEAKSQAVLEAAREHAALQQEREEQRLREETAKRFEKTAHGLHHLLSTAACRGVLKKHNEVDSQPTIFGTHIEEAIRSCKAPRRKFKRDLPPIENAFTNSHDPYDTVKELEHMSKVLDDKMRQRLHTQPFGIKRPVPPKYVTSVNQNTAFGLRVRWREEDKSKRIPDRAATTH